MQDEAIQNQVSLVCSRLFALILPSSAGAGISMQNDIRKPYVVHMVVVQKTSLQTAHTVSSFCGWDPIYGRVFPLSPP